MYSPSNQIKHFYTWLQGEGKAASSTDKMKVFFTELGIDVNQKTHDSLFIQHQAGLGLRELMKLHYSEEINKSAPSAGYNRILETLQTQTKQDSEIRYAFLDDAMIVKTAELFGIPMPVEFIQSDTTQVLSQKIVHSGDKDNGHFELENHDTVGNGNCALNALAQAFAVELGMALAPASTAQRANYIAGAFIPSAPISQEVNLNVSLQELKSLLSLDQTDLKAIIMEELSLKAEPTDAELIDFIKAQAEQSKKYQSDTTTPFRKVNADQHDVKQSSEYSPQQA